MIAKLRGRPSSGDNRPDIPDARASDTTPKPTDTETEKREDSPAEATEPCFLYNTPVVRPGSSGSQVFNIVKVVERPELGLKYANLGDGLWYPMNEDGTLREMTTPEFKDFIDWRIASLLSEDAGDSEPIAEAGTGRNFSWPDGFHSDFDDLGATEDREEEDFQWAIDAMNDDDLQYFSLEDFEGLSLGREGHPHQNTEGIARQPPTTPNQDSPRTPRKQRTRRWSDHSCVDENGLLDTQLRKRQEKGRKLPLRKRCNWLLVPTLPTYNSSSVPDLIMTSPGGGSYALHDPLDYE